MRHSKRITDPALLRELYSIKFEDLTKSWVMKHFGNFKKKAMLHPYDTMLIPAGVYGPEDCKNIEPFVCTVGSYIFNKFFIEDLLFDEIQWVDDVLTKKKYKKLCKKITYAVIEGRVPLQNQLTFIDRTEKFMPFCNIICPGFTQKMLTSSAVINKKKAEILPKYIDGIKAGDPLVSEDMEKELKDFAREYLKGDSSMDNYDSGARGSFDNNYKNMFIMKGAIKDPDPDKGFNIMLSNFIDGVSPEEYATFANSLAGGPYARAKKTEVGGYMEKQFLYAFQHIVLDDAGSDCHSHKYKKVLLTPNNVEEWMYSYIVEGNKLVELNSQNMDSYVGKVVNFRFSQFCQSKTGVCNACMGNLPYKIGIKNIGTALPKIPSVLKLISMKSFHDSVVTTTTMDVMKAFGLK